VLAHLAEVDARGAYRHWACETEQNHVERCARARYRRKSEIERLIAELAPAHDVPALVEPLGAAVDAAAPARAKSTWGALVEGRSGWVRELQAGDGPAHAPSASGEWHEERVAALEDGQSSAPARAPSCEGDVAAPAGATQGDDGSPPPVAAGHSRTPLRYKVQFTADQPYVELLGQARDLLWHRLPNGDLAQLQRLALEALVEKLMRRKHGRAVLSESTSVEPLSTQASRSGDVPIAVSAPAPMAPCVGDVAAPAPMAPREKDADALARTAPRQEDVAAPAPTAPCQEDADAPARTAPSDAGDDARSRANVAAGSALRSRHVPAAVRRSVWQRDGGRCSFVDARGVRCRATRAIEFHHERPYARGGTHCVENITLRCRSHNVALICASARGGPEQFYFPRAYAKRWRATWEPQLTESMLQPIASIERAGRKPAVRVAKAAPNEPCSCGSARKYKKCCGAPARA
jgi:5-methylcytosine-specific restriction endonuclease McrA